MNKEERKNFITDIIQNGEYFPVVIHELMKLDTITKVLIYEHYMKRIPWEKCGNYKMTQIPWENSSDYRVNYSKRQKINICNKGIDKLYDKLKIYM